MHASAAARAALLSGVAAALLVGLGGSIGPAAASTSSAPHRGPVTVHTLQHGMCHMAGDSADSLY